MTKAPSLASPARPSTIGLIPLSDPGAWRYHGLGGGLYENGSNAAPADHHAIGLSLSAAVRPRNINGATTPGGKIVLLSIGMSNTSAEWWGPTGDSGGPAPESFMAQAATHRCVDRSALVIVNGAQDYQDATTWRSPLDMTYDVVFRRLSEAGVTERQVQVVWLKNSNVRPKLGLPSSMADVYQLEANLASTLRAMKVRYPNLRQVFLSSRVYAGYTRSRLNPEPFAYESGFAVKRLIQAQVDQVRARGAMVDDHAGDLNYRDSAPWIAWAAYTWANGTTPRSDGLTWDVSDFQPDGLHPSRRGIHKVASRLVKFFVESPYTRDWFCNPTGTRLS